MGIGRPLGNTIGIDMGTKLGTPTKQYAVDFNGTSTYVDCGIIGGGYILHTTTKLSLNSLAATQCIHSVSNSGARLYVNTSGNLFVGSTTDTGYIMSINTEYTVELYTDSTSLNIIRVDVNGVTEWTGLTYDPYSLISHHFNIGARDSSGLGLWLNGKVSYFKLDGYCEYLFNEGKGATLTDVSGNGNDGTIVNGTWVEL